MKNIWCLWVKWRKIFEAANQTILKQFMKGDKEDTNKGEGYKGQYCKETSSCWFDV